jgi:hypothetical protein
MLFRDSIFASMPVPCNQINLEQQIHRLHTPLMLTPMSSLTACQPQNQPVLNIARLKPTPHPRSQYFTAGKPV